MRKIIRAIGFLVIPTLFAITLAVMLIQDFPSTLVCGSCRSWVAVAIVSLIIYGFSALTWRRSVISKVAVVLLQLGMAFFVYMSWFARI